ncbi:phytanoyl-CoA dioxygenase family protein [Candidatus Poriferisocius sp.]|uniref:phytanoyl-CoA dioxygenase family protein n=1 Tax=Candidatus Poriferisocius sp. TaxID=3101276 RepID=UPI003B59981D
MTALPQPASQVSPGHAVVTSRQGFDLDDLRSLVEAEVCLGDYPWAHAVADRALVYRTQDLRPHLGDPHHVAAIRNEMARALGEGPGVIVITGAIDPGVVDRATEVFERIIAAEHEAGTGGGDHYAEPGANDRLWNALEKLAVADPETFVDYHGCDMIDLAALAWLGPGYQITAQVNAINPGGAAQSPHRDYHVGFMTDDVAEQYPLHVHRLSPLLTLQGGVAHCHMPPETGATMLLPHSQKYELGYLAWRRPELIHYFAEHHVQITLEKGDLLFFSPAVFHAGGHNRTGDVRRVANLLQISSAMGRATEAVDRERIVNAIYPALLRRQQEGLDPARIECVVVASAEGYAFPTNLDRDVPIGGLTPPSQQDLLRQALAANTPPEELARQLTAHHHRRTTH